MPAGGSRRSWGWHPLTDEWAERVVAEAGVRAGELVLDVGAGHGALTRPLMAAGARVIAVELHPGRAAHLRERLGGDGQGSDDGRGSDGRGGDDGRAAQRPGRDRSLVVIQADVLRMRLPGRPFRVVASPPYAIASPLLRMLLAPRSRLVRADLVLPKAVVRRYASGAVPVGRHWQVRELHGMPRRAFRPPPRIDSAILLVSRR